MGVPELKEHQPAVLLVLPPLRRPAAGLAGDLEWRLGVPDVRKYKLQLPHAVRMVYLRHQRLALHLVRQQELRAQAEMQHAVLQSAAALARLQVLQVDGLW